MKIAQKNTRAFLGLIARFAIIGIFAFAAGRSLVWAQVWSGPANQPPVNNPGQPPTTSNFSNLLKKSPTSLQTVTGSAKTAAVSAVAGFVAGNQPGKNISIIAQNSFSPIPFYPAGTVGIYGYSAGAGYGLFGTTPPGTVPGYGVMGDLGQAGGLGGQFFGPVGVVANGSARGDMTLDGRITADNGYTCIEASGCVFTANDPGLDINNTNAGDGLYSYSATLPGIAIENLAPQPEREGKSMMGIGKYAAAITGYGAVGGVYVTTQGGNDTYTYTALVGETSTQDTQFRSRIGVNGRTTGGMGNKVSYNPGTPDYDMAAGIRACVKDSTGTRVNKYGVQTNGGIWAGDFGTVANQSCTTESSVMIDQPDNVGYDISMVKHPVSGFPVIAYHNSSLNTSKIAVCTSLDCSTKVIQTILSSINHGSFEDKISVAVDNGNHPIVVVGNRENADLWFIHCSAQDCSSFDTPTRIVNVPLLGSRYVYASMLIHPTTGLPVIVYSEQISSVDTRLHLIRCGNDQCTSILSNTDIMPSITAKDSSWQFDLSNSNRPIITYQTATGLSVVRCGNDDCTSISSNNVLSGITGGFHPVMRLNSSNIPIIEYSEGLNLALRLIKCGDNPCASVAANTVIDTPQLGDTFSLDDMVLNSLGNPVIAYGANPGLPIDQELRVATCFNDTCSSKMIAVADGTDYGGYFPSMYLENDRPVIAFEEIPANDDNNLRLMRCNSSTCAPSCISPDGNVLIAGTGSVNPAKGAVLKIGNTSLTKCNLIGIMRKAGITTYPACP